MSYIENYYKEKDTRAEDCKKFFNSFEEAEDLLKVRKEILKLTKRLSEEKVKCTALLNTRYNNKYEPLEKRAVLKYDHKGTVAYFDIATATVIDESEANNSYIYKVEVKTGECSVVTGYCFELGAVIKRSYKYSISTDNKRIKMTLISEEINPIIESVTGYYIENNFAGDEISVFLKNNNYKTRWYDNAGGLSVIDATYFLNKMYGLERKSYNGLMLNDVGNYSLSNKAFETIIKTAPENSIKKLLDMGFSENSSIQKLLGMSTDEYNKAVETDTLNDFIEFNKFLHTTVDQDKLKNSGLELKTTSDWLEYLQNCATWRQDLDFYSIGYDGNLANVLVQAYLGGGYYYHCKDIYKYYKFGKFCKYVIEEAVNQGFTNVRNFCSELHDYINCCVSLNVKPTFYSSYLNMIHDITNRNFKIKLEKDQEEIFTNRYKDFKAYKREKYSVIAPKTSKDVQTEGSEMCNCVSSYLKRILDGTCLILFMRYTESLDKSLVTLEIRDNALVQAKQAHNNKLNAEQEGFLKKFCKDRGLEYKA